jgi:outer membrane protein assembly factor BamB
VNPLLLMAVLVGVHPAPSVQGPCMRFVVVSDLHIPVRADQGTRAVVEAILAMEPPPAFVVDTGDATELGWRSEIDEYVARVVDPLEAAGIPVLTVPGNHDARWSETGLRHFRERIGDVPRLERRYGIGLMLMSTALPGEQHGQIEPFELHSLCEQRARMAPSAPALAFAHHPLLPQDGNVGRGVANLDALRAVGVTALFVGHGHAFARWRVNGVEQFMTGSALDGVYRIVNLDRDSLTTWGVNAEGAELPDTRVTVPLRPTPGPLLSVRDAHVRPGAQVADIVVARLGGPPDLPATVSVGGGEPAPLLLGDSPAEAMIDVSGLGPGLHRVVAQADTPDHGLRVAEGEIGIATPTASVDWIRQYDGSLFASPVLHRGRAYVASRAGQLECVDPVSGTAIWSRRLLDGIQATPAVDGNVLVVATTGGEVARFDARTGQRAWSVRLPAPTRSSPAIHVDKVYLGCGDGGMRCLDLRTGRVLWEAFVERPIESRPAVAMGRVVFGAWDQAVHCLNAATGAELWSQPVGRSVYYSPATSACLIHQGRVFASAPDNTIRAFDLITGDPLWEAQGQAGYTSPAVGPDGTIIYGSMNGQLIGLDPATGSDRFRTEVGKGTYNASAMVAGDLLTVGALSGAAILADARSGQPIETIGLGGGTMFATPAFDGRQILAGAMDGRLISLTVRAGGGPSR